MIPASWNCTMERGNGFIRGSKRGANQGSVLDRFALQIGRGHHHAIMEAKIMPALGHLPGRRFRGIRQIVVRIVVDA